MLILINYSGSIYWWEYSFFKKGIEMRKIIEKLIGSYSDREIKRIQNRIDEIESLEPKMQALSDEELKNKTNEFKSRIANGETLDDILVEAFSVVREAAWRVLELKAFRVQLIGGLVLHQGRISEMKTGEGKTLVATLPAYLNALVGKGVHVVTVNDYLARFQSEWMGKVYGFLGLSVGLIVHGLTHEEKQTAYNADITYGTNNEYGFDYLRDNMVIYKDQKVQRELNYAIVDEVDSILIDEARTPLIISGAGEKSTELYKIADAFAKTLQGVVLEKERSDREHLEDENADYIVDLKSHAVVLTEKGTKKVEKHFGLENLSDPENMTISHHISNALKANNLMKFDKDYVVNDGEIVIVDEFTGRLMYGRRYSDGLHQAIEAKEGVKVARESKTLATITFQNYFRMYKKLSGMTGTALTEEEEFRTIYNLDVIVIPTNRPVVREDLADSIYKSEEGKFQAVIEDIVRCNEIGRPVLVGTISIEKSEVLSKMLKKRGVKHEVLNAKHHDKEAQIVAQAGKLSTVTIATNMAGRGTDIILGGNPEYLAKQEMTKMGLSDFLISESTSHSVTNNEEILNARKTFNELYQKHKKVTDIEKEKVKEYGGIHIIGTERHESRRIDNQLRGRGGRQGDPGSSRFFISLEDELMKLFGSDKIKAMVGALGLQEDQAIEHKWLSNAIESAQKKVEGRNFEIRKHVIQYDDVMNAQREVIYKQRSRVLNGENLKSAVIQMIKDIVSRYINIYTGEGRFYDEWDIQGLTEYCEAQIISKDSFRVSDDEKESITREDIENRIINIVLEEYEKKEQSLGEDVIRELERVILLRVVDERWMDHIDQMDQLRQGIGLRAYGHRDPVIEYRNEGYDMFERMGEEIQEETIKMLINAHLEKVPERQMVAQPTSTNMTDEVLKPRVKNDKIGRNDLCSCGSGQKYKKCCGK